MNRHSFGLNGRDGFGKTMRAKDAHVAQLVEHVLGKDEVTRSIRVVGSRPSLLVLPPFECAADQHL